MLWLCGAMLVALTMSRHWVICTHDDGAPHLEINHVQNDHHHHTGCSCHHEEPGEYDSDGEEPEDPHDSCSHIELTVELGPQTEPDSTEVWPTLAYELRSDGATRVIRWIASKSALAPPATGPPRPREFLAAHATTVLLI